MSLERQYIDGEGWQTVPASGGGVSQSFVVRGPQSFGFNTAGLAAGIPFYTPDVGEILYDAWIQVVTAFDGTTPQADIGRGDGDGLWGDLTAPVDISAASGSDNVLSGSRDLKVLQSALSSKLATGPAGGAHTAICVFTTADALLLWASQDGLRGGAAVGGAAGMGNLYIVTATPTAFS